MTENQHNKAFHMRLTQKEYDNLHANAKRAGLPLSTYMRFMMKACRPKQNRPPDWFRFYRELCAIGNNLNQLTHLAHLTGDINAERYSQCYDNLKELMIALTTEMYVPEKLEATKLIQEAKACTRG